MITRADVEAAYAKTAGLVRHTPMVSSGEDLPFTLWFKCEFMQHTGSFKARGAFNRQLTAREDGELSETAGIVVASGGNAGLANAFAAARLGVPATVFVPETAPANKVAKLHAAGATVVQHGSEYAEAFTAAAEFAAFNGAVLCHAYDQPGIVAGAGGVGLEVLAELPDVDTLLVAVGGGGLMGGIAAAVEGKARVVGVEPETVPTLHEALAAGRPYALVFLDYRMPPGWNGAETLRRLRAVAPSLRVVLCSAYSDYSWMELSQEFGDLQFLKELRKPFNGQVVRQLALSFSGSRAPLTD